MCLRRGCLPGGVCPGGVFAKGVYASSCGQTDTCENITFPQLLLRTVKIPVCSGFCMVQLEYSIQCKCYWKYLYTADLEISDMIVLKMVGTWNTFNVQISYIPNSNSTEELNVYLK